MEKLLGFLGIILFLAVGVWQAVLRFRAIKLGYKAARRLPGKAKWR
jgi:hypothetical protein